MNIALILSGGTGSRLAADIPKQYIDIHGRPMITYCLETIAEHEKIDAIQIVADIQWRDFILNCMKSACFLRKFKGFSLSGKTRQLSIWNGLRDIREDTENYEWVLIHDAARPFVSSDLIGDCLQMAVGYDGVLPVLPMKDTVYLSENGSTVSDLLDRNKIFAGQAPEVFQIKKYYRANEVLLPDRLFTINGSTEPAVMAGMDIVMIPGDENNFKITTKADLERCRRMAENLMMWQTERNFI